MTTPTTKDRPARTRGARRFGGALLTLVFLAFALLPVACTDRQTLDAGRVIDKTVGKTQAARSYRFVADTQAGRGAGARRIRISGDWQKPDRLRMTISTGGLDQQVVMVGGRLFIKGSAQAGWLQSQQPGGPSTAAVQETLSVLKRFRSTKVLGEPVIDGAATVHVQATYDSGAFVGRGLGGAGFVGLAGSKAVADLWLDKRTGYLRKMVIRTTKGAPLDVTMRVTLSRFNRTPDITAPE